MRFFDTAFKRKNIILLSVLMLAGIAIFVVTHLRFIFWDPHLFPYVESGKIAHYYINYYDFGFVKRGLIPSVIKTTGMYPTVNTVKYLAFTVGIATCGLASYMIFKMRGYFDQWSYILFVVLIIFNSGTFANWGYDLGRYDQLLLICSILSFYFITQGALIKLIIISAIALLIHEVYLIMFFPILFYAVVSHSKFDFRQIGYLLLGIGIVMAALFFFGKIEDKSVEQIAQTIPVDGFYFGDAGIIWTRTLEDNFEYTSWFISEFSSGDIISLLYGGTYTLLVFVLLIMISIFNKMDWYGYLVIILASTAIFCLAIDYSRWYSLMMVNGFLYFGFCTFSMKDRKQEKVILTRQHLAICLLLSIFGLILGPVGVIRSFPLFNFF
jgi:hypothetical protein